MMRHLAILLSLTFIAALHAAELPKSFIQKHCTDCHDADTTKGDFRADLLSDDLSNPDTLKQWSRVLARVQSEEMPPQQRSNRPSHTESNAALRSLKKALHSEAESRHHNSGRVRTRRLNRVEYENTLHDLLGIQTPLRDLLPEDDLRDGFANQSAALSISPVHIQQYIAAADRALDAASVRQQKPETQSHRLAFNHDAEKPWSAYLHNRLQCQLHGENLHFFLDTHIEVPVALRQFESILRDNPGWYRIRITTQSQNTANNEDLIYSVWTSAGGKRRELIGHFDAPLNQDRSIEITRHFERGETLIVAPYRMAKTRTDAGFSVYLPDKPDKVPKGWHFINNPNPPIETVGPAIVIKPLEITGPIIDQWPPSGHQLLYGTDTQLAPTPEIAKTARVPDHILKPIRASRPLKDPLSIRLPDKDPRTTIAATLRPFIARAFRRPPTNEEVEIYTTIATDRLAKGECPEVAFNAAHRAILCSPDFLFLVEKGPLLSPHERAARLSYFLWRTTPDATLRNLAETGELMKPDVLRREAERMMKSPRFDRFINDFLAQWLNLREIDATTPDRDLFPEYFESISDGRQDILLHDSVVKETRAYFRDAVDRNLPAKLLVSASHTFLNQRLAEHYELPAVRGAALQRIDLPPDSVRGGILTHASILKVTANGANTSPVLRGVWLLERILGTPAPPPPPNAGSIEPDTRGATTIREQLEKHQSSKTCAGCHQKIDPPGFVLESFDPIGRHRTFYRTTETGQKLPIADARAFFGANYGTVKYLKGPPVDTRCELPNGTALADVRAYKTALASRHELIARNLARKLLTFATGVSCEAGDEQSLDDILNRAKTSEFGVRSILLAIVQSQTFNQK